MTVVVGVLVALAVLAGVGPPGRWPHGRGRTPDGASARRSGASSGTWLPGRQGWRGVAPRRAARRGAARRGADSSDGDLAGVLLAVAARLRAGATPQAAWAAVLQGEWSPERGVPGRAPGRVVGKGADTGAGVVADVVPPAPVLLALVERRPGRGPRRARVRVRRDDAAASRVHAVLAGARTAAELGAPLADVLEQLAAAVAADAEHAGEVAAALAGPRATARVLVLLPGLGLLVGAALGARPWQVLAAGGPGTAAGVLGTLLVLAGRAWVGALLRRARAAGGTA